MATKAPAAARKGTTRATSTQMRTTPPAPAPTRLNTALNGMLAVIVVFVGVAVVAALGQGAVLLLGIAIGIPLGTVLRRIRRAARIVLKG